jgi:glycosyltransferase involved in cell wall biosynthesis
MINISDPKMKIAIVWEQTMWGGVDNYLAYLLDAWPNKFDEITIFVNESNIGMVRLKNILGNRVNFRVVCVKSLFDSNLLNSNLMVKITKYLLLPLYFLITINRYKSIFKKNKFNILLAQNGCYPGSYGVLASIIAAKLTAIPVRALVIHHCANGPEFLRHNFSVLVDRFVGRAVTSVITISKATQDTLINRTSLFNDENTHAIVIHNGVPFIDKGSSLESKAVLGDLRNSDGGNILVGMMGRIEPYKGHEDAIFAFSELPQDVLKQIKLVFIGIGDFNYINRLVRLCKELEISSKVFFLGYVEGESVNLISNLDLLLVATRSFEGFGLSAAEAVSCGVPIIATRVGALPEIFSEKYFRLINPSSSKEISLAIEDFVSNVKDWKSRAYIAKHNSQYLSSSRMAQEYRTHLYQSSQVGKIS